MKTLASAVLLLLVFVPSVLAQDVAIGPKSAEVDAMFEAYTSGVQPGAAALVLSKGKILHANGYGYANLVTEERITPSTSFRLASVSKQFVCVSILILAERGAFSIDDPATNLLPELSDRYGDGITIRHLMNHTSGLPDYYNAEDEFENERPRTPEGARVFSEWGEPKFEPGEKFEYSNPGYEMLALIIERASKKSFGTFLHDEIFAPLGMVASVAYEREDVVIANRAFGYRPVPGGFVPFDDHKLNWMMGAGGIYSSLLDMARWDGALTYSTLIGRESTDASFTPAKLLNGTTSDYGFGWGIGEEDGRRRLSHSGGWVAFRTMIVRYPGEQLTVVVLTNRADGNPGAFAKKIAKLYLEGA